MTQTEAINKRIELSKTKCLPCASKNCESCDVMRQFSELYAIITKRTN